MTDDDTEFDRYETAAARTVGDDPPLWYLALGLTGEAGEVAEIVKKVERHGKPLNVQEIEDELGDVLWYLTMLAKQVGTSLTQVAARNVEKLKGRYPDGFRERGDI